MSEQINSTEGYKEKIAKEVGFQEPTEKHKIFLIQVPDNFDQSQLDGLELDKQSLEIQDIEQNEEYGIKRLNEGTQKFMKQQLTLLYPQKHKAKMNKGKQFQGVFKVVQKLNMPKISRKAIKKTIPNKLVLNKSEEQE